MNGAVSTLKKIECYDDARPGFPGEHWIVLGAGVGLRLATGRHRSAMVKTLGNVGATALAARAASGCDGLRWTPLGGGIQRR